MSRLDVYRVDTYSRVVGRTRTEVRQSNIGRSTSADYGLFLARAGARRPGGASQRSQTSVPDGRMSSSVTFSRRSRGAMTASNTPRNNQSQSHWAYFR